MILMMTKEVRLPAAVWYDALDPMTSGMQADLDLPEPMSIRVGKGRTVIYRDIPTFVVLELADYLADRAETMLAQDIDSSQRSVYYTMRKTAEKIHPKPNVGREKLPGEEDQ